MQYVYDEQGVTFNYFFITVLAIFLIPTTINLLKSKKGVDISKPQCSCNVCKNREIWLKSQKKASTSDRINMTAIGVIIGWIFFFYLAYKIATIEVVVELWDPYEVMGLREGTPLEVIKKTFKELSRKWHPDKAPLDKKIEYEAKFIDISKAYKVLTDEDIRRNFEEWGHPDGKQAYSLGIALPTWLVEARNSPIVLGIYAVVFGLLLPFYVGRWWYSSSSYTKNGIRTHTMDLYFRDLRPSTNVKQIVDLLSASIEFKELVEQRPTDAARLSPVISSIRDELDKRFGEKYEKSKRYNAPYCQKAHALLYAHLLRVNIDDKDLMKDKYFIIERSIHLVTGLLEIALAHRWLQTSTRCMEVSQFLVQAMWFQDNPLVQLPYVTTEVFKMMKQRKKIIRSIVQLRKMKDDDIKNIIKLSNDSEYDILKNIANLYPIMQIDNAYFKVTGYDVITPGSLVTLVVKVRYLDSHSEAKYAEIKSADAKIAKEKKNVEDNDDDDVDDDDDEKGEYLDSEDELLYGGSKNKTPSDEKSPLVHAPYLSKDKKPYWWIFMADDKRDRVIIEPTKITDIVTTSTFKFQFPAPREPGLYTYIAYIKSDSYMGTDIRKELRLDVKDFSALPPENDIDDDISEPEEDSLAGQLKLAREQGLYSVMAGNEKKNDDSDSSDDSDDD